MTHHTARTTCHKYLCISMMSYIYNISKPPPLSRRVKSAQFSGARMRIVAAHTPTRFNYFHVCATFDVTAILNMNGVYLVLMRFRQFVSYM